MQGLVLCQKLSQSHQLGLTQRIDLSQMLAIQIENIRGQNPPTSPDKTLLALLAELTANVKQDSLRQALESLVDHLLCNAMLLNIRTFAVPRAQGLSDFSLKVVFDRSTDGNGAFVHARDENGRPFEPVPKTTYGYVSDACANQETFRAEVNELVKAHKEQIASSRRVSFEGLHLMQDALIVAPALSRASDALANVLTFLLAMKDSSGRHALKEFALDVAVLQQLDIVLSNRLQKRFVARFATKSRLLDRQHVEECLLNSIGELTLVSMGIIASSVFVCQQGSIDEEMADELTVDMGGRQWSMSEVLAHYGLRSEGAFFWNRYHTLGRRPSQVTDAVIRTFISRTVRASRKEVLSAVSFDEFYADVREAVRENSPGEEREVALRELFTALVSGAKFQEQFVALLKGWYKYLDVFYA